jgi:4'-phosphopantetheinyl transferase
MFSPLPSTPARLWLLPHTHRDRGEPAIRPLLAAALSCPPDALPLSRDASGRPRLGSPFERFDASWSHSGERLLLALGEAMELGVDIERLRPRPRMRELARRFFHADEVAWLLGQDEAWMQTAFVRLWCAKEAVLKAHGQGISFGLEKLVFAERDGALRMIHCAATLGAPEDWHLHEWAPEPDYRAALAWRAL